MVTKERIDVVFPTLNRPEQFRKALQESIQRQSGEYDIHYIFVVDKSDKVTKSVIDSSDFNTLFSAGTSFRVVLSEDGCGNVRAVNQGISCSEGDVISFLSDDIFVETPGWDVKAVTTLAVCDMAVYDYFDPSNRRFSFDVFGIPYGIGGMVRREFAQTFPMLDTSYKHYYGDPDLGVRMLLAGKVQRRCGVRMTHFHIVSSASDSRADAQTFHNRWGVRIGEVHQAYKKVASVWLA